MSRHDSHRWEDISHHGSPYYQCAFCDSHDHEAAASLPCVKVEECLRKEAQKLEEEERYEYLRLKAARERWDYLHAKFGDK